MKVIPPIDLTLVSTNATESTAAWASGTTYSTIGDRVQYSDKIYEALRASTGAQPDTSPDDWAEVSATNPYKMFDMYTSTRTERTTSLTVTIDASKCDHFALFNMDNAESVTWSLTDTSTSMVVGGGTMDLAQREPAGWYDFFYQDFQWREDVVQDIPIRTASELTVTLTGATGVTVGCGHLTAGRAMTLGATKYGAQGGIIDYSKITTDAWGATYLSPGRVAKRMELDLNVLPADMDRVMRIIKSLRGKGVVWVGDNEDEVAEGSETLLVYGYYREVTPAFPQYGMYTTSLTIEGIA